MIFLQRQPDGADYAHDGDAARLLRDGQVIIDWTDGPELKGIPAGAGYTLEVRHGDQVTLVDLAVGMMVLTLGQSNMNYWFSTDSQAYLRAENGYALDADGQWRAVAGVGANAFAQAISESLDGIPVAFVDGSVPGSPLLSANAKATGYWLDERPGGLLGVALDKLAAVGGQAEVVLWAQGENDADGTSSDAYAAGLSTFFTRLSESVDAPIVLQGLGPIQQADNTVLAHYAAIRDAQRRVADADPDVYLVETSLALDGMQSNHLTPTSYATVAAAIAQQVLALAGAADQTIRLQAERGVALSGSMVAETLSGSMFDDSITGGGGYDRIAAGEGNDSVLVGDDGAIVRGEGGMDHLVGGRGADLLSGGIGDDDLSGGDGDDDLWGDDGSDILTGGDGDDSLHGGAGNDELYGGAGNDRLDAGGGDTDGLYGGQGDDTYVLGNGRNRFIEYAGEGVDTLETARGFVLPANIENLRLTWIAAANGTGNGADNLIWGNGAANILTGLAGADQLDGGGGIDTSSYAGSNASIDVSLTTGLGYGGHAQGDTLISVENLTGSAFADRLEGNDGNNILLGGAGNDQLIGGGGADIASFGAARAAYGIVHVAGPDRGLRVTGPDGTDTLSGIERLRFSDAMIDSPNVAPVAIGAVMLAAGMEDCAYAISAAPILGAYTDADGDALSLVTLSASTGTVSRDGTGGFLFTPDADMHGPVTLSYTIDDGYGGAVVGSAKLLIRPVDDDPVAVEDVGYAVGFGKPLTLSAASLLANDRDGDGDTLSIVGVAAAQHGTVSMTSTGIRFVADPGYAGVASFEYSVSDGRATATARVTLSIAQASSTYIYGTTGADVYDVSASWQNWTINANVGDDHLLGGNGNDVLNGAAGNDRLFGGAGNDRLTGGAGSDRLTGGAGGDRFLIGRNDLPSENPDEIMDFEGAGNGAAPGGDILMLSGFGPGATLVLDRDRTTASTDPTAHYYTVRSDQVVATLLLHYQGDAVLTAGDYYFT